MDVPIQTQRHRGHKGFDDDVVGADLCVRPDAEVDVSGQTHRSAPTASSLVVAITRCVKRFDNDNLVGALNFDTPSTR